MENIIKPTDSELEILNILWEKGQATVKEVNEEINKTKESGYTTTLKLLQIMHEKGLVSRYPTGKQHVYQAKIEEEKAQKDILNGFMHNLYEDGDADFGQSQHNKRRIGTATPGY